MAPTARSASTRCISAHGGGGGGRGSAPSATCNLRKRCSPYVLEMGFTHLESLPIAEHPVRGVVGTSGDELLRPHEPIPDTPRRARASPRARHRAGYRRAIMDWAPVISRKTCTRWRSLMVPSLQHVIRGKASTVIGDADFQFRDRKEVRNLLTANVLFGSTKYHIDGLRVDAVASTLYPDYRATGPTGGGRTPSPAVKISRPVSS